jgi:hypothetical protein
MYVGFPLLPLECGKCYTSRTPITPGTIPCHHCRLDRAKKSVFLLVQSAIKQILIGQKVKSSKCWRARKLRAANGNTCCRPSIGKSFRAGCFRTLKAQYNFKDINIYIYIYICILQNSETTSSIYIYKFKSLVLFVISKPYA